MTEQTYKALALLAEAYPQCFAVYEARRRPLKVGIHLDIIAALGGALTVQEIRRALRCYVGNAAYLRSMVEGAPRIDLDGVPAGTVTAEEAQSAKQLVAKRRQKSQSPAPAPAPPEKKRIGISDLKAAALARRTGAAP